MIKKAIPALLVIWFGGSYILHLGQSADWWYTPVIATMILFTTLILSALVWEG